MLQIDNVDQANHTGSICRDFDHFAQRSHGGFAAIDGNQKPFVHAKQFISWDCDKLAQVQRRVFHGSALTSG